MIPESKLQNDFQVKVNVADMKLHSVRLRVNGSERSAEVKANVTLLELLRDHFGLMGTKVGCETGDCGACTVLLEGEPVNSCLMLAVEADGGSITTIEGLEREGRLDAVQKAFLRHGAVQCGYCSPGMILAGRALLDRNPNPTVEEVREAISGNLCRCTGYVKIVEAIMAAAAEAKG
jgi:carbon-monoxide dehydrogenase small subunit